MSVSCQRVAVRFLFINSIPIGRTIFFMCAKNVFDTMRLRSGPWKIGSGQRRQGASHQFYLFLLKVQWTFKTRLFLLNLISNTNGIEIKVSRIPFEIKQWIDFLWRDTLLWSSHVKKVRGSLLQMSMRWIVLLEHATFLTFISFLRINKISQF